MLNLKNLKKVSTTTIYKDRFIKVKKDIITYFNNKKQSFVYFKKPNTAVIIAEERDLLYFVKQFRYPSKKIFLQFPLESKETNESFLQCAKRGLAEELQLSAKKWFYLGFFYTDPGISSHFCKVYLAKELLKIKNINKDEFEELEKFTLNKTKIKNLTKGDLEAWTLSSLFLYKNYKLKK